MTALGLDTSNYTTSAALFDGVQGVNSGKLLDVRPGELGLRQSEALFQHVKALPGRLQALGGLRKVSAIAASTRPRAAEGSYMPCFLAGESLGTCLAAALDVPFYPLSHQQGHLAAAAWSCGHTELLDAPFLAWHLSGGTTELLYVEPDGPGIRERRIGGTSDLPAGQLIDRTGVMLGLPFPAGRALDSLAVQASDCPPPYPVKCRGLEFSLSGMENQVKDRLAAGVSPAGVAGFALETLCGVLRRVTAAAREEYPALPVLFSGGVACNTRLRHQMASLPRTFFAESAYCTDNALGIAVLAHRLHAYQAKP